MLEKDLTFFFTGNWREELEQDLQNPCRHQHPSKTHKTISLNHLYSLFVSHFSRFLLLRKQQALLIPSPLALPLPLHRSPHPLSTHRKSHSRRSRPNRWNPSHPDPNFKRKPQKPQKNRSLTPTVRFRSLKPQMGQLPLSQKRRKLKSWRNEMKRILRFWKERWQRNRWGRSVLSLKMVNFKKSLMRIRLVVVSRWRESVYL